MMMDCKQDVITMKAHQEDIKYVTQGGRFIQHPTNQAQNNIYVIKGSVFQNQRLRR